MVSFPLLMWMHVTKYVYQKFSGEKSLQNTCQKKHLAKKREKHLPKTCLKRNLYLKKQKITFYPNISEEKTCTKQDVKGNSLANKNLNRNLFQTNSKKNLYQRIFEKNTPTQKSLKRNLYEKNICREISPPKNVQTICLARIIPNSEETFSARKK